MFALRPPASFCLRPGQRPKEEEEMNTQEKNKAQSRRALAEIDRGNFDIMDELSAPGATFDFPGGPKVDITGFKGFCAMFQAAFPDFVHDINDMVAEGEKVVRIGVFRGTHRG